MTQASLILEKTDVLSIFSTQRGLFMIMYRQEDNKNNNKRASKL